MIRFLVTLLVSLGLVFAVATGSHFNGRSAHADPQKTKVNDVTFGVQKDKMQSANKNSDAVKSLLRTAPPSGGIKGNAGETSPRSVAR
jgi:hypothetical protein